MVQDQNWKRAAVDVNTALKAVKSGDRIFVHGAAATPLELLEGLAQRADLEAMKLYHLHLIGEIAIFRSEYAQRFRSISFFSGANARPGIEAGRGDFIPVFLSGIPRLFSGGQIPLDVALVSVSPPDQHGMCTLGTSVDAARAAVDSAKLVIAQINECMPRTHGNSAIPLNKIHAFISVKRPLHEDSSEAESEVDRKIGEQIETLVEDRSCLQMGIGSIPNAALRRLHKKQDLGVHTEMFSDAVVDLVEAGVITNRFKSVHNLRITTSFVSGTKKTYDFVDDNSRVEFHSCERTNDPNLIRQNERVVAINSALEIDLTGQVCADSIGHRIYSGIGGQMDFISGASQSKGGKPIIALPSTAAGGKLSRIVLELKPGAGVVTTRGHVHWVITEYGAVNLYGLSLRERGEALISIAHPDFRGDLRKQLSGLRHY